MRPFLLFVLALLAGCNRVSHPKDTQSPEVVLTDKGKFVFESGHKHIDHILNPEFDALLTITWTTVDDFFHGGEVDRPQPDRFRLVLSASGHLWLERETVMRTMAEWTRFFAETEAENLFDSLMPAIKQFTMDDLRAKPTNYAVRFSYQTANGAFYHDCLIADVTPITALLVKLRLEGAPEAPPNYPWVQPWVRKRFKFFPPEP